MICMIYVIYVECLFIANMNNENRVPSPCRTANVSLQKDVLGELFEEMDSENIKIKERKRENKISR